MKLEKAIKLGKHIALPLKTAEDHDNHLALRILIEAGEQLQAIRQAHPEFRTFLLPGETEE